MDPKWKVINDLLVNTFNSILRVEQEALARSRLSDLSITEIHTIEAIGLLELKSMGELAAQMQMGMSTMTAIIDKLEQKGYVTRTKKDRRIVLLELTHQGEVARRMHALYHQRMLVQVLTGLDEQEEDVLISVLSKLNAFFNSAQAQKAVHEE